uniref:Uncharacterized protein n=1 Tax=Anguilla anguilla TaxID=7936 RepID=A0A0E9Q752_ANGAN
MTTAAYVLTLLFFVHHI